jgi:glycine/D-amino acid oxidase-like deaminating enzyme
MSLTSDADGVPRTSDVVVIGDGITGLSTALELARRGLRCLVFGAERPGVASFAAAGLLAPSIGELSPAARPFFELSLRLYPALVESLAELDAGLALLTGLLVVSDVSEAGERATGGERASSEQVRRLEPAVHAPGGGVVFAHDGAVDNVRLMHALRRAAEQSSAIQLVQGAPVASVHLSPGAVEVASESGVRVSGARAILAAGAWSAGIAELPRPVPVFPLKGQMLALPACPLARPVVGRGVYLVPRRTETVVGSTSELAGFDVSTTAEGIGGLHAAAAALCPELARSEPARVWAGVRPATPDMLPILGADPDHPELLYATGHSRNGILLAPATASAMADLVEGNRPAVDVSGFGIARFESTAWPTNLELSH